MPAFCLANTLLRTLGLPLLGCALVGGSAALFVWLVIRALRSADLEQDLEWRYDVNRINELRRHDWVYRGFYPLVQLLARLNRGVFTDSLPAIGREIQSAGLSRFWTPEEYLARLEVVALMLSPVFAWLGHQAMGPPGLIMALVLTGLTAWLLRRRLAANSRRRLTMIKRRMPFLLDLLTLLMEAGSTFLQALERAVQQFGDHPIGQEFGRVLSEIHMGKGRAQSLIGLRERLSDDEITAIVGSILQWEELGTPLAKIFRTQADVLRLKRTQRAETIAGEAGVRMLLPAVLIMAATVLIILGPFVLGFMYADILG